MCDRTYAVMCDSHRPFDNTVLARTPPEGVRESPYWTDSSVDSIWEMDFETAKGVVSNLVWNSPRIVKFKKAVKIIRRQSGEPQ